MARKAQWPPPLKRHATGQAYSRLPGGRNVYHGVYGTPEARAAYEQWVEQLARERRPAAAPAPREITVAEAVAHWAREVLPGHTASEQEGYRAALSVLCRVAGTVPAAAFSADDLEAVRDAMCSGSWLTAQERRPGRAVGGVTPPKRARGPWNRTTVNRRVVRIRTVWRWLERRRHVPRGAWAGLKALPRLGPADPGVRQPAKRRVFTDGEVVRAALAIKRGPCRLMLLLQLWSGMRPGEVRAMRWGEIDTTQADWIYSPPHHKNAWRGQSRHVVLGPRCRAVLRLALRLYGRHRSGLVFVCRGRQGRPDAAYRQSAYRCVVRNAARRAGLAGLTTYSPRHSFRQRVSRLCGLEAARAALGHKSVQMTAEYGDPVDMRLAADAARRAG